MDLGESEDRDGMGGGNPSSGLCGTMGMLGAVIGGGGVCNSTVEREGGLDLDCAGRARPIRPVAQGEVGLICNFWAVLILIFDRWHRQNLQID